MDYGIFCVECSCRGVYINTVCPNCGSYDVDNWHRLRQCKRYIEKKWWNPFTWLNDYDRVMYQTMAEFNLARMKAEQIGCDCEGNAWCCGTVEKPTIM